MKDVKPLLFLIDNEIRDILDFAKKGKFDLAYEALRVMPQPPEFISIGKSEIDGAEYQYNDIELIEGIMHKLFDWGYTIVNVHSLNDKGRFATTSVVDVHYKFAGEAQYRHQGGGATSYCPDIKGLVLNTPKSISQAKKNACKYLGSLLGLDLNREAEELPIVQVNEKQKSEDDIIAKELEAVTKAVQAALTFDDAMAIINVSPFKFNPQLKELANQKIN